MAYASVERSNFPLIIRQLHAAGKRDSEGGEERGEKESSKAERPLGLGHGRRRVRRRLGKSLKGPDRFTRTPGKKLRKSEREC